MNRTIEAGAILRFGRIDARVEPYDWAFARENAVEIAEHWAGLVAAKPAMFNGRVMLQHRAALHDGVFEAGYFETDYASFIAWRDAGHPGPVIRNGFAMGALRSSDGAFLCGKMGDHTANAGMVYFAAGTPDPGDVRPDGTLDLAGSVMRELGEETGLRPDEVDIGEGWTAVVEKGKVAFMREVGIDLTAEKARALMLGRMKELDEEELSDIVVIRSLVDTQTHDMPVFMRRYLDHIFNGS